MKTLAILLEAPERLSVQSLALKSPQSSDVVVEIHWSGVSTGTEKLLWTGQMPDFPGMGYPLVPGYESVGRIVDAGAEARERIGEWVFVPGASCFEDARGLFGGNARTLVVPSARIIPISESLGESGVLFALAATAHHAVAGGALPELIVGHGVLGRLMARLAMALGGEAPTVWETDPARREGAAGYPVIDPATDDRRDYASIVDVSGDASGLDNLIGRVQRGGEIALAGFYSQRLSFDFAPAFRAEARMRVAAEWQGEDITACRKLVDTGALSLSGLVSDIRPASEAAEAYPAAFADKHCLKMVLDWSECA